MTENLLVLALAAACAAVGAVWGWLVGRGAQPLEDQWTVVLLDLDSGRPACEQVTAGSACAAIRRAKAIWRIGRSFDAREPQAVAVFAGFCDSHMPTVGGDLKPIKVEL